VDWICGDAPAYVIRTESYERLKRGIVLGEDHWRIESSVLHLYSVSLGRDIFSHNIPYIPAVGELASCQDEECKGSADRAIPSLEETPIFVISLSRAADRRARIGKRLELHQLTQQSQFIDAVPAESKEVSHFANGRPFAEDSHQPDGQPITRREAACFLSHLKALKAFLASGRSAAIIFEDDAVLHNNFRQQFDRVTAQFDFEPPLVLLMAAPSYWTGTRWVYPGITNITPAFTTATGYWITRSYALEALGIYDKLYTQLPVDIRSEHVTRFSRGFSFHPALIIPEVVDSYIHPEEEFNKKFRNYLKGLFDIRQYLEADTNNEVYQSWMGVL
jgi:hypothetical protein